MKTLGEILDLCDELVTNRISSTTKVKFLNDILHTVRKYNTKSITLYTDGTAADTQTYDLPSYVSIEDITYLGVSNSTFNTTVIAANSTTYYVEYKFKGQEDPEVGLRYFEHSTQYGLYPIPDDAYYMKIIYNPYLGPFSSTADPSSDAAVEINVDGHLTNYIQDKLCAKICKSGAFPRLDLANNYELDAMENLNLAMNNYYKTISKKSKRNISYKRWW